MSDPTAPAVFWRRIVLAWLGVALIMLVRNWAAIATFRFPDPDDALRLVQVRDLLDGQGWFDLRQYRIDPPAGTPTHWSRLVDLPLALLIAALRPLLGQPVAEQVVAALVPLLTLLCAMLLTARIAGRLFGERAAYGACVVWIMALAAMVQLQPLRIDHHGWQIVSQLAALAALLDRDARRGARIAGLALAIGLSISLELLPFAALIAGVLGLRWLRGGAPRRDALVQLLLVLAGASCVLFVATRGLVADSHCDTVSPALLAAFLLAALLTGAIARIRQLGWPVLVGLLGLAAGLTGALYLALAPQCLAGPFAELDPLVRSFWYDNVLEGLPVWRQDLSTMVQMIIPPLIGLAITLWAWARDLGGQREALGEFALVLAGAIVIALLVSRFSSVATAIATVPLGFAVFEWLRRAPRLPTALRLLALPVIFVSLVPGVAVGALRNVIAQPGAAVQTGDSQVTGTGCSQPQSLTVLARLPRATLFAPFEIGPSLLVSTPHAVIATGHHRSAPSIEAVIKAFTAAPDQAEALVRRHGATHLVTCSDLIEARNYVRLAPQGLMARLLANQPPPWLERVPLPPEAGTLTLWRVVPPAQPGRNSKASPFMQ